MIVWWDESGDGASIMQPPTTPILIRRIEQAGDDWHIWYTQPVPAQPAVNVAWGSTMHSVPRIANISTDVGWPETEQVARIRRAMIRAQNNPGRMISVNDDEEPQ